MRGVKFRDTLVPILFRTHHGTVARKAADVEAGDGRVHISIISTSMCKEAVVRRAVGGILYQS